MNVVFIPVRGGSKSIPLKNIKPICGKPLVYWTVKAACECRYVDEVYVATDSDAIRDTVLEFKENEQNESFEKIHVIGRSAESASDTASTESAMIEFAENYDFDNLALVQATSPLLTGADLDRGFEAFNEPGVDSVLSTVPQKRFNWAKDAEGYASPSNYDFNHRPRRQEFDGYMVENGAFYISTKEGFMATQCRLNGRIKAVEMNEDSFFEIDEPSDWIIIEALMKKNGLASDTSTDNGASPANIKMLLTDCDGCLTDGGMYYSENGDELKKFNTRDGVGFRILREKGILTGIITGENVELNRRRAKKLELDILAPGCKDKLATVQDFCEKYNVSMKEVLYVGDDANDIDMIQAAGFSVCPADACERVKKYAGYVTKAKGGEGVIREVVEKWFVD